MTIEVYWCASCKRWILLEPTYSHIPATPKQVREAHQESVQSVCPVCRDTFTPRRSNAVYCSPKCRQKGKRLGKETVTRREKDDTFMRRCQAPSCSRSLIGMTARARYCSDACRVRAAYDRRVRASEAPHLTARGREEGSECTDKALLQARNLTEKRVSEGIGPVGLSEEGLRKEEKGVRENESGHRPQ